MSCAILKGAMHIPVGLVDVKKVKDDLTYSYQPMGADEAVRVQGYRISRRVISVPRVYGIQLCNQLQIEWEDHTSDGVDVSFPSTPEPRQKQIPVLQQIAKAFDDHYDCVLKAHTGFGKTIVALTYAASIGKATLVVVDQENLKDQWIEKLLDPELFGFEPEQVGSIQGKVCDYEGKLVTVAMVQTLSSRELPREVYDYFGLIIGDEVHTLGAPTFSQVLLMFSAGRRLFVSATPRRRDGLQKALNYNCGPVRVAAEENKQKSKVYIVRNSTVYSWYANISPKVGRIINEVADDAARNYMIACVAAELWEQGRDFLIMSDRVQHLEELSCLLYYMGVPEEELGLFTGYTTYWAFGKEDKPKNRPDGLYYEYVDGHRVYAEYCPVALVQKQKRTPKARYKEILDSCSIVLATYGKFQKGADLPRLSAGIDATPRSAAEQVQGRVQRVLEGKPQPIWVTVFDENNYRLVHSLARRVEDYRATNSDIYEWDGAEETKKWTIPVLLKELRERVDDLKEMKIVGDCRSSRTLLAPAQQKREKTNDLKSRWKALRKKKGS